MYIFTLSAFSYRELGQEAAAAAKIIYEKFMKGNEIRNNYIKLGKEKKEEYMVFIYSISSLLKYTFDYYKFKFIM